ncbi:MAG TPA: Spy/CpxP family protein refolding chaperone [Stellaceae bacterium]|nr:Spy/CpxP family protein refolding chaperone [Stellaceae bacterium]
MTAAWQSNSCARPASPPPRVNAAAIACLYLSANSRKVIAMRTLIDRFGPAALVGGFAAAVIAVPLACTTAAEVSMGAGSWQLAQAGAAKRGAPQGQAQPAPPPGQPGGPDQDIEQQINELRKKLKITQPQQAAFDGLAQVMRQNAQSMDALAQQQQQNQPGSAVEDLRTAVRFSEAETEGLKRLLPALETLYNSLSDQQKRTVDQVLGSNQQAEPPPQGKRR